MLERIMAESGARSGSFCSHFFQFPAASCIKWYAFRCERNFYQLLVDRRRVIGNLGNEWRRLWRTIAKSNVSHRVPLSLDPFPMLTIIRLIYIKWLNNIGGIPRNTWTELTACWIIEVFHWNPLTALKRKTLEMIAKKRKYYKISLKISQKLSAFIWAHWFDSMHRAQRTAHDTRSQHRSFAPISPTYRSVSNWKLAQIIESNWTNEIYSIRSLHFSCCLILFRCECDNGDVTMQLFATQRCKNKNPFRQVNGVARIFAETINSIQYNIFRFAGQAVRSCRAHTQTHTHTSLRGPFDYFIRPLHFVIIESEFRSNWCGGSSNTIDFVFDSRTFVGSKTYFVSELSFRWWCQVGLYSQSIFSLLSASCGWKLCAFYCEA